jgi:hypothetical protein
MHLLLMLMIVLKLLLVSLLQLMPLLRQPLVPVLQLQLLQLVLPPTLLIAAAIVVVVVVAAGAAAAGGVLGDVVVSVAASIGLGDQVVRVSYEEQLVVRSVVLVNVGGPGRR